LAIPRSDAAAAGTGETAFGDAEAPPAGEGRAGQDGQQVEQDLDELVAKAREQAQAADRGVSKVAKELLPALDHLELALKAAEGHEDVVKGFAMVGDELAAALGRVGVEGFSPEGEPFDPNEHEAMAQLPADGVESGTVIEVYQRGWRVNGAVLRPARVVVAQ
jgi:molecular chaperone GrpE